MSIRNSDMGDLFASDGEEVHQPLNIINLNDSDRGSDIEEGPPSPSDLEIIGVRRNRPVNSNLVELPQSSIQNVVPSSYLNPSVLPEPTHPQILFLLFLLLAKDITLGYQCLTLLPCQPFHRQTMMWLVLLGLYLLVEYQR